MKIDPEPLLVEQRAASGWRIALASIAVAIAAILAVYWQTARSIHAIWDSSQTYTHGYVIVPMVLFLVWRARHEVGKLAPRPDILGFVLLGGFGMAWLVATAAGVQVLQQYAFVAMIPATVVALAGRDVGRALVFPLAFLLLAVPFGEAFVPILMDWTADMAVTALRLSGLPVFREATFFELPTGRWSVVEACSGVRYLIASFTVGVLYAYLNYRALWKRALFVALSIAVPILANGLRVYIIVMIGHLSSMKLAVGADHLVWGWVTFGLVILVLFWLGSFWRDGAPLSHRRRHPVATMLAVPGARFGLAAVAAVSLAAASPLYAKRLDRDSGNNVSLSAPAGALGWVAEPVAMTQWRPHYSGDKASIFQVYRKGEHKIALYIGYYRAQRQGAELVGWPNSIVASSNPTWQKAGERGRAERFGGDSLKLRETHLRSARQRLLVWDWYRVAGVDTSNPYVAKALLARDRLLQRDDDSAAIILATPYEVRSDEAERTLREFANEMRPSIDAALARAKERSR